MKYKVVTNEIYEKLDDITYTIETLKNTSYVLSECMVESNFTEVQLESLATIIHDRLRTLYKEIIEILPQIEPEEDDD